MPSHPAPSLQRATSATNPGYAERSTSLDCGHVEKTLIDGGIPPAIEARILCVRFGPWDGAESFFSLVVRAVGQLFPELGERVGLTGAALGRRQQMPARLTRQLAAADLKLTFAGTVRSGLALGELPDVIGAREIGEEQLQQPGVTSLGATVLQLREPHLERGMAGVGQLVGAALAAALLDRLPQEPRVRQLAGLGIEL